MALRLPQAFPSTMEQIGSEERTRLRAAIQRTLDCVEQLHARPPLQWPETARRLIADLRVLQIRDAEILWALLSVVTEQIDQRRGTSSDSGDVSAPSSSPPPIPSDPDHVIELFEQRIAALVPADMHSPRHARIERIVDYVETHYQEHLTLDLLAAVIGRHKVSLADDFKDRTGLTVHNYLTRVRVRRAAELLKSEDGGSKIEAVMMAVGYRSKKNFYRQFKDHYGVTPGVYRQQFLGTPPPADDDEAAG
jgi:AraC-like DNA-binding protein